MTNIHMFTTKSETAVDKECKLPLPHMVRGRQLSQDLGNSIG